MMPEVVRKRVDFPGRGRQSSIDWDSLMDGRPYRFVSGKDFDSDAATVQSSAHQAAARRGMKAQTKQEDGNVIVQFYVSEEEPKRDSQK